MADDHLSIETVQRVARLSRLALSDEQIRHCAGRLDAVLGYIERLRSLDLEGVQPLTNPLDARNRLDDDVPSEHAPKGTLLRPEDLMKMAPASMPPFVKVPKVLGDDGGA